MEIKVRDKYEEKEEGIVCIINKSYNFKILKHYIMNRILKFILFVFLVASTNTIFGQEFLGVKVDGKLNDVITKFKSKGFKITSPDEFSPILEGKAGSANVELFVFASPISKTVYKFAVLLPKHTDWESIKSEYEEYFQILSDKYGKPKSSYNFFSSPYNEGDGDEMNAIQMEKCSYSAYWKNGLTNFQNIGISISKYSQVIITYENDKNYTIKNSEDAKIKKDVF